LNFLKGIASPINKSEYTNHYLHYHHILIDLTRKNRTWP
jgi:hypothetical protein